jgi:hypothetical protein
MKTFLPCKLQSYIPKNQPDDAAQTNVEAQRNTYHRKVISSNNAALNPTPGTLIEVKPSVSEFLKHSRPQPKRTIYKDLNNFSEPMKFLQAPVHKVGPETEIMQCSENHPNPLLKALGLRETYPVSSSSYEYASNQHYVPNKIWGTGLTEAKPETESRITGLKDDISSPTPNSSHPGNIVASLKQSKTINITSSSGQNLSATGNKKPLLSNEL